MASVVRWRWVVAAAIAFTVLTLVVVALVGGRQPEPAGDPASKSTGITGAAAGPKSPPDLLAAFRGLSTWIDTYDVELSPEQQIDLAADAGVDTVFVQSSRQSTDGLIHDPDRLGRTIELAHDAGMKVMVWSIPDFADLELDRQRAIAAMTFTTPRGDTADAFGLDIEVEEMAYVPVRTRRLLQLSRELRAFAGDDYPMAAIVLPPRQLELNTTWWPDFPYEGLAEQYDVFVPMSYSSYRGTGHEVTFEWNRDNVTLTRDLAGDPDLPVHLAGGIADDLPAVTAFVRAAFAGEVIGAGLYDLHTTTPEAWGALRALRLAPS